MIYVYIMICVCVEVHVSQHNSACHVYVIWAELASAILCVSHLYMSAILYESAISYVSAIICVQLFQVTTGNGH